jgi:Rps23 Pro-64 3,4-dihydroxylase Tpa1-like proline 4-hydroxylase
MTELLNKELLVNAQIKNEYFPFIHVDNIFFNMSASKNLIKDFPNISQGGSFNISSDYKSISQLVEDFKSIEIKEILENKFNINLKESIVVPTIRGFSREKDGEIHSDSSSKILTILIYLNEKWDHENGSLRLLKNNDSLENYIKEIPAIFGNMVIFEVTKNCWHGYKTFVGKRRSIQINYVYRRSKNIHKIRHALSSFFKYLNK